MTELTQDQRDTLARAQALEDVTLAPWMNHSQIFGQMYDLKDLAIAQARIISEQAARIAALETLDISASDTNAMDAALFLTLLPSFAAVLNDKASSLMEQAAAVYIQRAYNEIVSRDAQIAELEARHGKAD